MNDKIFNVILVICCTFYMAGFVWTAGLMLTGNYPCLTPCYGDSDCTGAEDDIRAGDADCRARLKAKQAPRDSGLTEPGPKAGR